MSTTRTAQLAGLRQQIGHGHRDIWPREWRDGGAWAKSLDVEVTPAELCRSIQRGRAIDLEHRLHEVHDPVISDAGTRVQAALVAAVEGQARLGNLDQESRAGGCSAR